MNRSVGRWSVEHFEQSNGLDTALYQNILLPLPNDLHHKVTTPDRLSTAKAEQPAEAEPLEGALDSSSTKDNKINLSADPTPDALSGSLKKTLNLTRES